MALYPGALASFAGFTATHTLAADNHAAQHNLEQAEILAVQTKVGTGSSTPAANTVLTGTGAGTSSWAQVNLATMVSGVLPIANGGNGTTSTTGTGSAVFSAAPVLTGGGSWSGSPSFGTPTISDFTNAIHSHQNATGGGQLNAANALSAGSVSFANLLSTIFSGQVQTYTNTGNAGGTFSYINLGGLKLLWGYTDSVALAATAFTSKVVNFPASFFSATPAVLFQQAFPVTTANVFTYLEAAGTTTSQTQLTWNNTSVAGSAMGGVVAIGT